MSPILHRSAAALAALACWVTAPGQERPAFRAGVETVPLFVTVADRRGRPVAGLRQEDFVVLDNGAPRPITVFAATHQPVTAVLMLDMGVPRDIALWQQAAGEVFVAALGPGDRARIGTFSSEIAVSPLLSGDKGYLLHVLHEELWPGRQSPIWAAFDHGMSSLAREPGRRVVIVFTGGGPDAGVGRRVTDRDVALRAARDGFTLYAVAVRDWGFDFRIGAITDASGGRAVRVPSIANAGAALGAIVEELHAQYAIGFAPAALDGATHAIEVVVNYKNLDVRARRSYVAAPGR